VGFNLTRRLVHSDYAVLPRYYPKGEAMVMRGYSVRNECWNVTEWLRGGHMLPLKTGMLVIILINQWVGCQ